MSRTILLRSGAALVGVALLIPALTACDRRPDPNAHIAGLPASASNPNGFAPTGGTLQPAVNTSYEAAPPGYEGVSAPRDPPARAATGCAPGGLPAEPTAYVNHPPPPIPRYDQPPPPGPGYYWTPGYWDWSEADTDYYWVPGAWVLPPSAGLYWTPGYWSFVNNLYAWFPGYWGPEVGYYGGVDYGWGYDGRGYWGGRWANGTFWYNREANNLRGVRFAQSYSQGVRKWGGGRASFSGGPGGARIGPSSAQVAALRAARRPATVEQRREAVLAARDPRQRAGVDHGRPAIMATSHAGDLRGAGPGGQVVEAGHETAGGRPEGITAGSLARGAALAGGAAVAAHALAAHGGAQRPMFAHAQMHGDRAYGSGEMRARTGAAPRFEGHPEGARYAIRSGGETRSAPHVSFGGHGGEAFGGHGGGEARPPGGGGHGGGEHRR